MPAPISENLNNLIKLINHRQKNDLLEEYLLRQAITAEKNLSKNKSANKIITADDFVEELDRIIRVELEKLYGRYDSEFYLKLSEELLDWTPQVKDPMGEEASKITNALIALVRILADLGEPKITKYIQVMALKAATTDYIKQAYEFSQTVDDKKRSAAVTNGRIADNLKQILKEEIPIDEKLEKYKQLLDEKKDILKNPLGPVKLTQNFWDKVVTVLSLGLYRPASKKIKSSDQQILEKMNSIAATAKQNPISSLPRTTSQADFKPIDVKKSSIAVAEGSPSEKLSGGTPVTERKNKLPRISSLSELFKIKDPKELPRTFSASNVLKKS